MFKNIISVSIHILKNNNRLWKQAPWMSTCKTDKPKHLSSVSEAKKMTVQLDKNKQTTVWFGCSCLWIQKIICLTEWEHVYTHLFTYDNWHMCFSSNISKWNTKEQYHRNYWRISGLLIHTQMSLLYRTVDVGLKWGEAYPSAMSSQKYKGFQYNNTYLKEINTQLYCSSSRLERNNSAAYFKGGFFRD